MTPSQERIFVQIPSYRDTECQWTVKDLFDKAMHPERIFVGICWQYVPEEDQDCFLIETRPEQVRIAKYHIRDSNGVCWARHHVQKLWDGEEYTLQIDSHMRFVENWDTKMIGMLNHCESPSPILSTYPPRYTPPNDLEEGFISRLVSKEFIVEGIHMMRGVAIRLQNAPEKPIPGAFCSAGFIFSSSKTIEDVPYDPHLYFRGEEITLAVRLWTHGWDFFAPNKVLIYHYYGHRDEGKKHWVDNKDWVPLREKSFQRVRHLLGTETSNDPEVTAELDKYGFGTKRSLSDYEEFSGVNFKEKIISKKAKEGRFCFIGDAVQTWKETPRAQRSKQGRSAKAALEDGNAADVAAAQSDDTSEYSYDLVPYESHSFPRSHPDNLATVATLFGMTPAPIDNCRVLELGCAGGGNIIPMACNSAESDFVGIDLSARQIGTGQGLVNALELTNIQLLRKSIDDLGRDFGTFDYIIVHGVYSWVSEEIREKIISVCKRNLAENGVAYVSYNTYPGWHMPEALREMMLYHVSSFKDAKMQTRQARALLGFLQQATADNTNAYSLFLKNEVENLGRKTDSYIFHEFLEAVNHPVYFQEFASNAERHGLQYLGEANVSAMLVGNFPEKIARKLRLAGDIIRREQYMDFLFNRRFRATMLCHAEQTLSRKINPDRVADFYISSAARPKPENQNLRSAKKVTVVKPGGRTATIAWNPGVRAALPFLWDNWPKAIPFSQLFAEVRDRVLSKKRGSRSAATEQEDALRRQLASDLLRLYLAGIVRFHRHAPNLATDVSDRPKVAPLTRLQAERSNWVTNQWHRSVGLRPFDRSLVQNLDGEHDRPALEAEMTRLVEAGTLGDEEAKDVGGLAQRVQESVERSLRRAVRAALLIQ